MITNRSQVDTSFSHQQLFESEALMKIFRFYFREGRLTNLIINQKYALYERIHKCEYSEVYLGKNLETNEFVVNDLNFYKDFKKKSNETECKVLEELKKLKDVPKFIFKASISEDNIPKLNCEMELIVSRACGPSLKIFNKYCDSHFSHLTIYMIGFALANILESIHHRGIIHGNIKPSKIIMSDSPSNFGVLLTGFKDSRKFKNLKRIQSTYKYELTKYSSLSQHMEARNLNLIEAISYKDDFESLAYLMINYFQNCEFFGAKESQASKESNRLIKINDYFDKKQEIVIESLLGIEQAEFFTFFNYVKSMDLSTIPQYLRIQQLFEKAIKRCLLSSGDKIPIFDWVPTPLN